MYPTSISGPVARNLVGEEAGTAPTGWSRGQPYGRGLRHIDGFIMTISWIGDGPQSRPLLSVILIFGASTLDASPHSPKSKKPLSSVVASHVVPVKCKRAFRTGSLLLYEYNPPL